jgi:hypothetical protein
MIDRSHELSLTRQAKVLGISRGSVYSQPQPTSAADLALMRRIDELHLEYPFAGSRMLRGLLRQEGHDVGRLHVSTLMKKMGIEALYRRPNTSKPAPGHIIAIGRLRTDPKTKAYVARRIAEGHSKLDAIRALKRYIAREVFSLIIRRQKEINQTRIAA